MANINMLYARVVPSDALLVWVYTTLYRSSLYLISHYLGCGLRLGGAGRSRECGFPLQEA